MPRFSKSLPNYPRTAHKSGQARVKWQGKTIYLGKHGTPESHDAYSRFLANLPKLTPATAPAAPTPPPNPTHRIKVKEVVLRFYQYAEKRYRRNGKPTGEHVTVRCALRPLKQEYGEFLVNGIGPDGMFLPGTFSPRRLKDLQESMEKRGDSRVKINRMRNVTVRAFTWAASEGLIDPRVASALKTVAGLRKGYTDAEEYEPIHPVSDEDIEATLAKVSRPMVADMIRIHRLTGMRPGELLAMTRAEIETKGEVWLYKPGRHKTDHKGKSREIPLGPRCKAILTRWMLKAGDGRIFPMARDKYRRAVIRAAILAGVPEWTPNRLRHTFATATAAKHGLEVTQVLLGHSSPDMTMVYAEADVKKAREVARLIG
jgi:integrase